MKIKNIAAICKKNKYAVIYERYTEGGGVVQYIGDGAAAGMQAIAEILDCVGVAKWEDLTGAFIRCEHQGWGGKIIRIGNLIKDKWFSLEAFFKEVKEAGGGE